jgi:hypothetical protein
MEGDLQTVYASSLERIVVFLFMVMAHINRAWYELLSLTSFQYADIESLSRFRTRNEHIHITLTIIMYRHLLRIIIHESEQREELCIAEEKDDFAYTISFRLRHTHFEHPIFDL